MHNRYNFLSRTLFVITMFMLFSCGKDVKELVVGRWKIEDITAPEPDMTDVPEYQRAYYKDQITQQQQSLVTTGYYEFEKEGKGFFELEGNRMEGKWRLSEDKKQLMVKEAGDNTETVFTIKEITDTKLVIELTENNQTTRLEMKKEK